MILCGDLNVAHREIDLANPVSNQDNAGFTDEEREECRIFLQKGSWILSVIYTLIKKMPIPGGAIGQMPVAEM